MVASMTWWAQSARAHAVHPAKCSRAHAGLSCGSSAPRWARFSRMSSQDPVCPIFDPFPGPAPHPRHDACRGRGPDFPRPLRAAGSL